MDFLRYDFMKNALLAICIITPMLGILGTMVVHKKMAYFSDALGHSALTGIAVGVICGVTNVNVAMVCFGIVFALLLNQIKFKNLQSVDTVISVFASASLALGLAILSKGGNFAKYSALLVGDVLSISQNEIIFLLILLALTVVYWMFAVNRLVAISVHPTLAKAGNIRVRLYEDVFAVLVAVVVMLSIRWIGILLINALFILPAASARNISRNMQEYHVYTIAISLFSGVVGLIVSYYTDVATGPMIVLYAAVIYAATYIYGRE